MSRKNEKIIKRMKFFFFFYAKYTKTPRGQRGLGVWKRDWAGKGLSERRGPEKADDEEEKESGHTRTSTVLPPLRAFFTTTCLSMRSLSAAT